MKTVQLDIVTPERKVYSEQVEIVNARTVEGAIGVLPGHAPLVAMLEISTVRMTRDGREERVAVSGGFMEALPEKVTILAEAAELPEEIDVERAKRAKERAERRLSQSGDDIDVVRAELALRRALNRLEAASK